LYAYPAIHLSRRRISFDVFSHLGCPHLFRPLALGDLSVLTFCCPPLFLASFARSFFYRCASLFCLLPSFPSSLVPSLAPLLLSSLTSVFVLPSPSRSPLARTSLRRVYITRRDRPSFRSSFWQLLWKEQERGVWKEVRRRRCVSKGKDDHGGWTGNDVETTKGSTSESGESKANTVVRKHRNDGGEGRKRDKRQRRKRSDKEERAKEGKRRAGSGVRTDESASRE
jgi:hypothetical protein